MAGLNDIEFDMTAPPGLGGPWPDPAAQRLETLSLRLQDRSEKLAAMKAMLMERRLQSRATATRRPILNGWASSLFGMRADPFTGKPEFHYGIDYAGRAGS